MEEAGHSAGEEAVVEVEEDMAGAAEGEEEAMAQEEGRGGHLAMVRGSGLHPPVTGGVMQVTARVQEDMARALAPGPLMDGTMIDTSRRLQRRSPGPQKSRQLLQPRRASPPQSLDMTIGVTASHDTSQPLYTSPALFQYP